MKKTLDGLSVSAVRVRLEGEDRIWFRFSSRFGAMVVTCVCTV